MPTSRSRVAVYSSPAQPRHRMRRRQQPALTAPDRERALRDRHGRTEVRRDERVGVDARLAGDSPTTLDQSRLHPVVNRRAADAENGDGFRDREQFAVGVRRNEEPPISVARILDRSGTTMSGVACGCAPSSNAVTDRRDVTTRGLQVNNAVAEIQRQYRSTFAVMMFDPV
jgi:hypothetical protein